MTTTINALTFSLGAALLGCGFAAALLGAKDLGVMCFLASAAGFGLPALR